jgi:RHS repeat-associated protein
VPTVDLSPSTANTISLIDTFQESTNLIPLASKAPAPGNQVAHLVFTLSDSAPPGSSIAITLDPSVTLLSDEGGNTSESPANGTLVLVDGAINIPSQMGTTPNASMANIPAETVRPARFLRNAKLASGSTRFSPRTFSYLGTTNHDAAFGYDEAGDVLHDDTGRSFTYDALSMTTGATAPLSPSGTRTFAYIYTADDERIALAETLPSGATTINWTLRGLDNHLLRTWTNSSWREDDIWRGAALLAYESSTGVRHYGLDHLGSPAIITDALGHSVGPLTFDPFGNGGATGAGMLQYTGQERDSFNVGPSPGTVNLPDYLHARYYGAAVGRFLSVDPMQGDTHHPQSWNRYSYVVNQPINNIDPKGLCTFTLTGGEKYSDDNTVCAEATANNPSDLEYRMTMANIAAVEDLHYTGMFLNWVARDFSAPFLLFSRGLMTDRPLPIAAGVVSAAGIALGGVVGPEDEELLLLNKQMASESQVADSLAGGGRVMAGEGTDVVLRDEPRLVAQYGPGRWAKVTSEPYKAADGHIIETHFYKNLTTGQIVELKQTLPWH